MAIAVDANRDGTIAFSGAARDTTSQDAPFRFWCNDDDDHVGTEEEDIVPVAQPDYQDDQIEGRRDLEDFARLHLFIDAFHKELADGTFRIGLKFKNAGGTTPKIKVYRSTDPGGSDSYLKDEQAALAQVSHRDAETLREVADGNPMLLPREFWTGNEARNSKKCLLFEAGAEGKGELVMTVSKSDGTQIGEGPSVWLDLKNIKKMYVRAKGTPERNIDKPWDDNPSLVTSYVSDPNGHHFVNPPDEEKTVLIYVHGIRAIFAGESAAYLGNINVAETMAPRHFQWVEGTDLMGAVRPQAPHRSPRQAFGGNFG